MNSQIQQFSPELPHESAQVVAVSSGYAHPIKSSLALNLAICLTNLQKKVCVFDTNETHPEQKLLFGPPSTLTMKDLMKGDISIDDLIYEGPGGVKIIPQSSGISAYSLLEAKQKQNLLLAITQLQHDYDFLLIDTAAGIDHSTISFLLGAGSIVITITPQAASLNDAFTLLKGIKQRVFQQPVKVIVNLVAGEIEAKQIIARLSVTVRQYLGIQCEGLSFFILDDHMLAVISQTSLVTLQYPRSVPSQCLKNIAYRLIETRQTEANRHSTQFAQLDDPLSIDHAGTNSEKLRAPEWFREAIYSVQTEPIEMIESLMEQLNEVWHQRKMLQLTNGIVPNVVEIELLKLKTAIHFASLTSSDVKQPSQS
jgi:MinD-like ATPase involved in chromosome partitioning or flagellar assembly